MAHAGGPRPSSALVGVALLAVSAVSAAIVASSPAPYVIERPGPVFDVLGDVEVEGQAVPLISIPLEETYPTEGALRMLTVSIAGTPGALPNWLEVAGAYLDPRMDVLPVERVYPPGVTEEETAEESRIEMENSQREAIAAALVALDYPIESDLTVEGFTEGAPSVGVLETGDRIVSVNGRTFESVQDLREALADNGVERPAEVVFERAGVEHAVEITPILSDGEEPVPVLGILVASEFEFPFTVRIQLENVGGPSAGMMFALGIIDKLTEGSLTGGEDVAGTGTIAASGEVGAIGGIRQKMYGARDAGSDWFLAPVDNCDEVVGHVPDGLRVVPVSTLDDALAVLGVVRAGGDANALPTCEQALQTAR